MMDSLEIAKRVLLENSQVLYGIFGVIESSGFFPPRPFLNEFLAWGSDPCDQDGLMKRWPPLVLTEDEYEEIKTWWISLHPDAVEDSLDAACWNAWVQRILDDLG